MATFRRSSRTNHLTFPTYVTVTTKDLHKAAKDKQQGKPQRITDDQCVRIRGRLSDVNEAKTSQGEPWAYFILTDGLGSIDVMTFSLPYETIAVVRRGCKDDKQFEMLLFEVIANVTLRDGKAFLLLTEVVDVMDPYLGSDDSRLLKPGKNARTTPQMLQREYRETLKEVRDKKKQ
jgi:DNA polymerase III alpha subunit